MVCWADVPLTLSIAMQRRRVCRVHGLLPRRGLGESQREVPVGQRSGSYDCSPEVTAGGGRIGDAHDWGHSAPRDGEGICNYYVNLTYQQLLGLVGALGRLRTWELLNLSGWVFKLRHIPIR